MLKLIEGSRSSSYPREMDAMFRNRALTFSARLGWDVCVKNGYERDVFDDANPIYLVSVDPNTNEYWGSLRLLPTIGPNMLRDVFPYLLAEDQFIESATIWESSRICAVATEGQPERCKNGVNVALGELLAGIGEVAIIAGLTQIVSVFDARIYRVLRAAGCDPQIIGRPRRIGGTMSYAGLLRHRGRPLAVDLRRARDSRLRARAGYGLRPDPGAGGRGIGARDADGKRRSDAPQSAADRATSSYAGLLTFESSTTSVTMASRTAALLTPTKARCSRKPCSGSVSPAPVRGSSLRPKKYDGCTPNNLERRRSRSALMRLAPRS